jgi:hypothetical protein
MATPQTYQASVLLKVAKPTRNVAGLSKLFEAAVVNRQFCALLLNTPEKALQQGYQGHKFNLTSEEQDLIISIRASTLSDLAQQVTRVLR